MTGMPLAQPIAGRLQLFHMKDSHPCPEVVRAPDWRHARPERPHRNSHSISAGRCTPECIDPCCQGLVWLRTSLDILDDLARDLKPNMS